MIFPTGQGLPPPPSRPGQNIPWILLLCLPYQIVMGNGSCHESSWKGHASSVLSQRPETWISMKQIILTTGIKGDHHGGSNGGAMTQQEVTGYCNKTKRCGSSSFESVHPCQQLHRKLVKKSNQSKRTQRPTVSLQTMSSEVDRLKRS